MEDFASILADHQLPLKVMIRSGNVALVTCNPPNGIPRPRISYQRTWPNRTTVNAESGQLITKTIQ